MTRSYPESPDGGDGEVTVRFVRRDGRPARAARMRLIGQCEARDGSGWLWAVDRRTDEHGFVTCTGLPPGEMEVKSLDPGLLSARAEATLIDGGRAVLVLREVAGETSVVVVVDENGRPLPGTEIEVKTSRRLDGVEYVKLTGDVQELELFTDANGRLELPGLPPGTVRIEARWDVRTAKHSINAGEGLRIEIPLNCR